MLMLNENQLAYLPAAVGGLCALEELDCRNNKLRWLPRQVAGMRKLKKFVLRKNNLRSVPAELVSDGWFWCGCWRLWVWVGWG